jgi:DNA (cytosine-5)-methyltransferase 1
MRHITYGSVCSGIEAATAAWHPLGFIPLWLSEIEPFPSAVLAARLPEVTNHGDMTALPAKVLAREIHAPTILVGGTPCQAFSVAGARAGLTDPRGQLTLSYAALLDAIDTIRIQDNKQPAVAVWENVPGVLSDKGNAFGCFLGLLAGEDDALVPAGGKWTDAGCVFGPKRTVAWRVLDAQYFGLAQRRRRVFVVASARNGFDPAAVLFESEGVRRDSAPCRDEAGQPASGTACGPILRCGCGYEFDDSLGPYGCPNCEGDEGPATEPEPRASWWDGGQVSQTLDAVLYKGQTLPEKNRFPAVLVPSAHALPGPAVHVVHGTQYPCVSTDTAFALGCNNGGENAVLVFSCKDYGADAGELSPTLRAMGHGSSHANAGGQVAVAVSLRGRDGGATAELGDDVAGCLRASSGGGDKPYVMCETLYNKGFNHGGLYASTQETHAGKILRTLREAVGEEAFAQWGLGILGSLQSPEILRQALHGVSIRPAAFSRSWVVHCALSRSENGSGWLLQSLRETGCEGCPPQGWEPSEQLTRELGAYLSELSQPGAQASRFVHDLWWAAQGPGLLREALSAVQEVGRPTHGQSQPAHGGMQVRRLTVEECEFLQGFPRGYTAIPWRGKPADQCPDGPRYKAIGNSKAVPVVRWIGERIKAALLREQTH